MKYSQRYLTPLHPTVKAKRVGFTTPKLSLARPVHEQEANTIETYCSTSSYIEISPSKRRRRKKCRTQLSQSDQLPPIAPMPAETAGNADSDASNFWWAPCGINCRTQEATWLGSRGCQKLGVISEENCVLLWLKAVLFMINVIVFCVANQHTFYSSSVAHIPHAYCCQQCVESQHSKC